MRIGELQKKSYEVAEAHGFWDIPDIGSRYLIPTKLMLIVSEAAEALDNVRDGTALKGNYLWTKDGTPEGKPEGLASELTDIIIRTCDLAEYLGIDLESVIAQKQAYNETRPFKHGKTI